MRITKRLLIGAVVVLALAAVAAPVIAASDLVVLEWTEFEDTFTLGDCTVGTKDVSTKHIIFDLHVASTGVGMVTILDGPCVVDGVPIPIPDQLMYAVVNLRNPRRDAVIKSYVMVRPAGIDVPVGARARLTRSRGDSRTYLGYAYFYEGVDGPRDYQIVPFRLTGTPPDYTIQILEPQ
jgi:hypothetical protein